MIVSNTCVNRVAKVFKVVLDKDDLLLAKTKPIDLFPTNKNGSYILVFNCFALVHSSFDGSLLFHFGCPAILNFQFNSSYNDYVSGFDRINIGDFFKSMENYQISVDPSSDLGVLDYKIEFDLYYFEEKALIPWSWTFLNE